MGCSLSLYTSGEQIAVWQFTGLYEGEDFMWYGEKTHVLRAWKQFAQAVCEGSRRKPMRGGGGNKSVIFYKKNNNLNRQ